MMYGTITGSSTAHELVDADRPEVLCGETATKLRKTVAKLPKCGPCGQISNLMSAGASLTASRDSVILAAQYGIKGDDMATPSERTDTIREITDNIERVRSLAEADNAEAAAELAKETEALISDIKGTGSVKVRKELREALTAAGKVEDPKPSKEVSKPRGETTAVAVGATKDYALVPGVGDLIAQGAEVASEGISAQRQASTTAQSVAEIIFGMRVKMENSQGLPDLKGSGQETKKAARAMYEAATGNLEPTDANRETVEQLMNLVQYRMSQVVVDYVRSLNDNPDEYAALYGRVKEAHPDLEPAAAIFEFYKLNPKSKSEVAAEKARNKALAAQNREAITSGQGGGEGEGDGEENEAANVEESPDDYAVGLVRRMQRGTKGILDGIEKFKAASDETKAGIAADLEAMQTIVEALLGEALLAKRRFDKTAEGKALAEANAAE